MGRTGYYNEPADRRPTPSPRPATCSSSTTTAPSSSSVDATRASGRCPEAPRASARRPPSARRANSWRGPGSSPRSPASSGRIPPPTTSWPTPTARSASTTRAPPSGAAWAASRRSTTRPTVSACPTRRPRPVRHPPQHAPADRRLPRRHVPLPRLTLQSRFRGATVDIAHDRGTHHCCGRVTLQLVTPASHFWGGVRKFADATRRSRCPRRPRPPRRSCRAFASSGFGPIRPRGGSSAERWGTSKGCRRT